MTDTNLIEDLRLLSPPDYSWLGLGALLAVLVLLAVVVMRASRRTRAAAVPVNAHVEAWNLALAALERLTPLLRPEHSRDYAIQATGILRCYIETRYGLLAPRLATEEFLRAARFSVELPRDHQGSLGIFLEWCDLFKFGRYQAPADELQKLHTSAEAFLLASRPTLPAATDLGVAK